MACKHETVCTDMVMVLRGLATSQKGHISFSSIRKTLDHDSHHTNSETQDKRHHIIHHQAVWHFCTQCKSHLSLSLSLASCSLYGKTLASVLHFIPKNPCNQSTTNQNNALKTCISYRGKHTFFLSKILKNDRVWQATKHLVGTQSETHGLWEQQQKKPTPQITSDCLIL